MGESLSACCTAHASDRRGYTASNLEKKHHGGKEVVEVHEIVSVAPKLGAFECRLPFPNQAPKHTHAKLCVGIHYDEECSKKRREHRQQVNEHLHGKSRTGKPVSTV